MPLTAAQLTTLKTNILANTTTIPSGMPNAGAFVGVAIQNVPNNGDGNLAVATWYNLAASPDYFVWNQATLLKTIRAATDLSKYTPSDSVPVGPSTDLTYSNRAFICQLKQSNAIFLIQGEGTVDSSSAQFRASCNDCMTAVPSGASGANQNAGWGTSASPGVVRLAMQRLATNAEKIYSVQSAGTAAAGTVVGDARGGATNPDTLVVVGNISASDVNSALNLP